MKHEAYLQKIWREKQLYKTIEEEAFGEVKHLRSPLRIIDEPSLNMNATVTPNRKKQQTNKNPMR